MRERHKGDGGRKERKVCAVVANFLKSLCAKKPIGGSKFFGDCRRVVKLVRSVCGIKTGMPASGAAPVRGGPTAGKICFTREKLQLDASNDGCEIPELKSALGLAGFRAAI